MPAQRAEIAAKPKTLARLEEGSRISKTRNIDAYLDTAVFGEFRGLVVVDERRPELQALTRQLRLVLMVPRAWVWDLQRAELGVAGFLAKPFDRDALLECVRRVD